MIDEHDDPVAAAPERELAPSPAQEPATKPKPGQIADVIDRWRFASFHGTRLGNDTELWNLVYRATEDLKLKLASL